jgi:hypothetical protein
MPAPALLIDNTRREKLKVSDGRSRPVPSGPEPANPADRGGQDTGDKDEKDFLADIDRDRAADSMARHRSDKREKSR